MGMSVAQASIDQGKGRFAIAYPFRPGQTNIRLSYQLPYTNNSASFGLPATYPGAKMLVVVPPGVTVTGDGLVAAGQEQGMMVFTHDPLPAKGVLTVNLSGIPSGSAAGADQGQLQPQEGNSRQGQEVIAAPSRLDSLKWYIFAGLAALFAMGALLLSRKQIVVPAADVDDEPVVPKPPAANAKKSSQDSAPSSAAPSNITAAVEQQIAQSMDSLKEQIFRLELRRQAGTISEEDYTREKARIDQLLRHLVQG
jgi:hypothetical protein